MHLIEAYSSSTRLKIDQPWIAEKFFPLTSEKFVTLQSQGAMNAKAFLYWQEVIDLLKPIFDKYKIDIIQLGSKDEQPLNNVINLLGLTNLGQSYYIVKKALLHAGIDSSLIHFAAAANKKIVGIYSVSSPKICGPFNFSGLNQKWICLEPEFENGQTYTFNPNENPSLSNSINPEQITNAVLESLELKERIHQKTIFIGKDYKKSLIELIPNHIVHPENFPNVVLHIRGDLHFSPEHIFGNLAHKKCLVVIDQPLDIQVLKQLKQNLVNILYLLKIENKERDLIYIKQLHESGLPYILLTDDAANHNNFKFDYLDYNPVILYPINKKTDIKNHEQISVATCFKTNKLILSDGKIYASQAHWKEGICIDPKMPNRVIDNNEFFLNSDYMYFYNES